MVLEKLFERLLAGIKKEISSDSEEDALAKMIDISSKPSLMYSFSFGKYNGKTIQEVLSLDRGYLEWFLNTKEKDNPEDEDWIYTLKHYLGKLQ
jgi:uncharacterized protein (DUF3820 family)